MGTSKKNRGKQRKAAKQQAASSTSRPDIDSNAAANEQSSMSTSERNAHLLASMLLGNQPNMSNGMHHQQQLREDARRAAMQRAASSVNVAVQEEDNTTTLLNLSPLVQKGDENATILVKKAMYSNECYIPFGWQSGVLSIAFGFLQRCEDETLGEVMVDVGGDMSTPTLWIDVLSNASRREPRCRLEIAENIGPLVRCMCNDTERLFFKSNKNWREGIESFVLLIYDIISKSVKSTDKNNKNVVNTLLNHEGLMTSVVQWAFWGERPDILKELMLVHSPDECDNLIQLGRGVTFELVKDVYQIKAETGSMTTDGKERLQTIGQTPIVCQDYDPNCNTSFVEGLSRLLQTGGGHNNRYLTLLLLVEEVDCVDKGVIKEIINLVNVTDDYSNANHIARASYFMLIKKSMTMEPCDTRIAFAIRHGLIEMCLRLVGRFGCNSLLLSIGQIFKRIHDMSFHQKTAKAIRSKRGSIQVELVTNSPKCKELLDIVVSILGINGSHCCRCNKTLTRTEVMECDGCHCMAYCSRACQRTDWLDGHSLTCCKEHDNVVAGQFQGRIIPKALPEDDREAAKLKELEKNINMIQLKLFLDHSDTILSQVEALGIPLCDCVVHFQLSHCPPMVSMSNICDYFNNPETREGFEETRSKGKMTCVYYTNNYKGEVYKERVRIGNESYVVMQRFFPHKWLTKQSNESGQDKI